MMKKEKRYEKTNSSTGVKSYVSGIGDIRSEERRVGKECRL